MLRPINQGTLVQVAPVQRKRRKDSEGGIGTVEKKKRQKRDGTIRIQDPEKSPPSGLSLFDVRYKIDGRLSQNVTRERIEVANLETTARRRLSMDDERPSLLSPSRVARGKKEQTTRLATNPSLIKHSTSWLISHATMRHDKTKELIPVHTLQEKKIRDAKDGFEIWRRSTVQAMLPKNLFRLYTNQSNN